MTHDELDVLNARLETLQTQITRMFNFLQGAAASFTDAVETCAELSDTFFEVYADVSAAEKEKKAEEESNAQIERAGLNPAEAEWVPIAEALPPEGETVMARWSDNSADWTYYKKSVEYPGAFCFYNQAGQAVVSPKEWLLGGGPVRAAARNIN